MISTCEEEKELIYHPAYITVAAICVVSSIASLIYTIIILFKYRSAVCWHINIKILIGFNIVLSTVLAILDLINFGSFLVKLVLKKNPCDVILELADCQLIRWIFLLSFCLISLTHIASIIERLLASRKLGSYEVSKSPRLAILMIFLNVLISVIVVYFILLSENHSEVVPHCLSLSATQIGNNIYYLFAVQCCAEVMAFFAQKFLLAYNRKRASNPENSLSAKYQITENTTVLEQMNLLIITCSAVIGGYNLIALIIRIFKNNFTKNTYIIIVFYIFIIPHLPVVLNAITHRMLKKHVDDRAKRIRNSVESSTAVKFRNGNYNWETAYENKYSTPKHAKRNSVPMAKISG